MSTPSNQLAQLLRRIAKIVEKTSLDELDFILQQLERPSETSTPTERKSKLSSRKVRFSSSISTTEILDRLRNAIDRSDGEVILRDLNLSRRELLDLAHSRSIHIAKEDNVRKIEEKLVESIIGSKLNSKAIRGIFD